MFIEGSPHCILGNGTARDRLLDLFSLAAVRFELRLGLFPLLPGECELRLQRLALALAVGQIAVDNRLAKLLEDLGGEARPQVFIDKVPGVEFYADDIGAIDVAFWT